MHLSEHNVWYEDEWWYINPLSYSGNRGAPIVPWHTGSVTESADAWLYYSTYGLVDPKMPFEAWGIAKAKKWLGWRGLAKGAAVSMSGGILAAGTLFWALDLEDRREGGIAETDAWHRFVTGDWFGMNSDFS